MAAANPPRLSVGLPVYNGERFLRFALDSLLNQTFRDFELIISDNASTDETMKICQEYASHDARIRYYRNIKNVGAAGNFNRVFDLARGQYFKWAAADDVISPDFLEKCINVLDHDPSVVLCYTRVNEIDSSGEICGVYDYPMRVDAPEPRVRFAELVLINHFCVAVFGVARRAVLAQTPLIGRYVGSDRVLLAELGLRGRMVELPEYLFHRRDHPNTSGRQYNMYNRLAWFDPSRQKHLNLVYWTVGWEYFHTVNRVRLPWRDRLAGYRTVFRWFWMRRAALLEDMKAAVVQLFPFSKSLINHAKRRQNNRINTGGGI